MSNPHALLSCQSLQLERDLDAIACLATRRLREIGQAPDVMWWGDEGNLGGLQVLPEIANQPSYDEHASAIDFAYLAHKVYVDLQGLCGHFP
jgi:hypothetical protein